MARAYLGSFCRIRLFVILCRGIEGKKAQGLHTRKITCSPKSSVVGGSYLRPSLGQLTVRRWLGHSMEP